MIWRISILFFLIASSLSAQRVTPVKVPLSYSWALNANPDADLAHVFVKGDFEKIADYAQKHGGKLKYTFKSYAAICITPDAVLDMNDLDFVEHVHFEYAPGQPLLSQSRIHTNVNQVHAGSDGLPSAYTGDGVIIGVIDAGIELLHPDFMHADSSTRIIELWDQTMSYSATRTPMYGYGQVWDSADINAGICPHQDQAVYYGHGTNSVGTAAGNGMSSLDYIGIAPETELIIVSSNFNALGWTNTVADAVNYIFKRAEALGRPCVINASLGTYLGSHDATDLAAQFIDQDITAENGRALICAAGNSGAEAPYHLGYEASNDTNFTWFVVPSGSAVGNGIIGFEMYGDVNDFETVQFAVGADQISPQYNFRGSTPFDSVLNRLNVLYSCTLFSSSGNYLAEVSTYADSTNGVYRLQFIVNDIDSVNYRYRLRITGTGRLDVWSAQWLGYRDMVSTNLPSSTVFPEIINYKAPDINQSIVSSWACSEKVITVGNYINRNTYIDVDQQTVTLANQIPGAIAANSSWGPSRRGLIKPEVTAPGDNTLTAGAFFQLNNLLNTPSQRNRVGTGGLHHRAGGASTASPVVAGISALFFEKCSNADWQDLKTALTSTTIDDQYTGVLPNDQWGFGKVDALEALKSTTPNPAVLFEGENEFCEGESLTLTIEQSYPSILWSTGSTSMSIVAQSSNLYFAEVIDERNCLGYSDSVSVFERPLPLKPSILMQGDNPSCPDQDVILSLDNEYGAYEWSSGQFLDRIHVAESGTYFCTVKNIYQCENTSDSIEIVVFTDLPKPIISLQADDRLFIAADSGLAMTYSWYYNGSLIENENSEYLSSLDLGVYQGSYIDSNGCEHLSNQINVYALGDAQKSTLNVAVFPNPMHDQLEVQLNDAHFDKWELLDAQGRIVLKNDITQPHIHIQTTSLSEGAYFLRLISDDNNAVIPVIK